MKREYFIIGLKLAISIGLLIYVFMRIGRPNISDIITNFHPLVWSAAVCLILGQLFLLSYRWHLLINIGRQTMSFWQSLQLSLASVLANTIFVSGISGVGMRIAMALYHGASLFKSLIATVLDRLLSVGVLGFFVAISLPAFATFAPAYLFPLPANILSLIMLAACITALPIGLLILKKLSALNITFFGGLNAVRYVTSLSGDQGRLYKILGISFIAQTCFFLAVFCVASDRVDDLPIWMFFSVLPAISFIASLPISIGGWGVRESAFVLGLSLIGVDKGLAFLLSVEIGLLSMLSTIIAGAPALWLSDRILKKDTAQTQAC